MSNQQQRRRSPMAAPRPAGAPRHPTVPAGDPILITLPGQPKGKGRPRFTRKGHAYTPAGTRSYEGALRKAAMVAMAGRKPLHGPLEVSVVALFGVPASWSKINRAAALRNGLRPTVKPDADNLLKCLDALNEVVFGDDKQIVLATIAKRYDEVPRLEIMVRQA